MTADDNWRFVVEEIRQVVVSCTCLDEKPKITDAENAFTQWLRYLTRERRNSVLPKTRELLCLARD
jgi:hypothetical protein